MKACPVCQQHNSLEAGFCPRCGHQFRTNFAGGPAPTQMVSAQPQLGQMQPRPQPMMGQPYGQPMGQPYPQPMAQPYGGQSAYPPMPPMQPGFLQGIFDPSAKARYQADLSAYMMATGQPAPYYGRYGSDYKKFYIWAAVILVGWFVWNSYHTRSQSMTEKEQLEKQTRDMAAKYQKEIDQNPVNTGE